MEWLETVRQGTGRPEFKSPVTNKAQGVGVGVILAQLNLLPRFVVRNKREGWYHVNYTLFGKKVRYTTISRNDLVQHPISRNGLWCSVKTSTSST